MKRATGKYKNKYRFNIIALAVSLILSAPILLFRPEPVLATRLTSGEGYKATLYDKSNGLPTSDANAIVQTEDGFICLLPPYFFLAQLLA